MRDQISRLVIVFGLSLILIQIIGYVFHLPSLVCVIYNPTGGGGVSTSRIPILLSFLMTIIYFVLSRRRLK